MLKQLLKYEFKATGRTYGGLYLALVALAVLSGTALLIIVTRKKSHSM